MHCVDFILTLLTSVFKPAAQLIQKISDAVEMKSSRGVCVRDEVNFEQFDPQYVTLNQMHYVLYYIQLYFCCIAKNLTSHIKERKANSLYSHFLSMLIVRLVIFFVCVKEVKFKFLTYAKKKRTLFWKYFLISSELSNRDQCLVLSCFQILLCIWFWWQNAALIIWNGSYGQITLIMFERF